MTTGKDRQRKLAREHHERQMARRAQREAKAKRNTMIGSAIGVIVVVGGIVAATTLLGGGDSEAGVNAAATPTPTAPTAPPSPTPTPSPTPLDQVRCDYKAEAAGNVKKVGAPPAKPDLKAKTITFKTSQGDVVVEFNTKQTPCTVNSFVHLAKENFFDGTKCHRLTASKDTGLDVLQCGDPLAKGDGTQQDGTGGPDYRFGDEALGSSQYEPGTVAMANSGPNTNGSQFFFVYGEFPVAQIGANYTPFGKVVKGMDVLKKVAEGGNITPKQGDGEQGPTPPKLPVEIKDVTISHKS
ncbi:peptidylprolyl isomerase [Rhizohabitans arisaemae]|uniref:peptidylprolyl isomerase n=1 Tax=Rhizohabitans arisaemae TaxID=2720610 RepID=UPI0024B1E222|nr:peptidylprolyl isomerase [Rhizohabitans arisaemae]